jgi:hypothetical protein
VIYELRNYTLVPGTQPEFLRLSRDVGREIRGDRYGKLEGVWTTEIGPLNRYVHLWSYPDPNERERLRRGLAQDERWSKEYVPQIQPMLLAQENTLLYAVEGVPFAPPTDGERHVYELRSYRTHVGKMREWIERFKEGLIAREKHSKIVGLWHSEVAGLNRVMHLWAYRDLNHRAEVRAAALRDPDWQAFLGKSQPLLVEMESTVLVPTETSPLR